MQEKDNGLGPRGGELWGCEAPLVCMNYHGMVGLVRMDLGIVQKR